MTDKTASRTRVAVLSAALLLLAGLPAPSEAQAGSTYVELARLLPADVGDDDQLGSAVAVDGDTVVVGRYLDDHSGERSGSAYVFVRDGATWTEQTKLTASDASEFDLFGAAAAIEGDTVVVGRGSDSRSDRPGAAYVFVWSGNTWVEQAKLMPSEGAVSDGFGSSVAISGETVVVGSSDRSRKGSATVFVRSGSTWTEQAKLTAETPVVGDEFGFSVTVEGDTAVVGARNDGHAGEASGSAFVFGRSGVTWTEQAKLTASNAREYDEFGSAVAISGNTVVVGSGSSLWFEGAAYVFVNAAGSWTEQAILRENIYVVGGVAIEGDTAVVGDPAAGTSDLDGGAYVFTRTGSDWTQSAQLLGSDARQGHVIGSSVSMSGDTVLIAGGGGRSVSANEVFVHTGGAYVFGTLSSCTVVGTEGADELTGSSADDVICGLGGDDTIDGLAGNDTLIGGEGDDVLIGGAGRDYLAGGAGADDLRGNDGRDDLRGGRGDDTVTGGAANDLLRGGDGDDLLIGGPGRDRIFGVHGLDSLAGGAAADQLFGGPDADTLRGGRGSDQLSGADGKDRLRGNDGDDLLVGSSDRDRLWGGGGDDILEGATGTDLLRGGSGDDTLLGGPGDDFLNGAADTDYLDGGDDTDVCINGEAVTACEGPPPG